MRYLLILALALTLVGAAEAQAQKDTLKPKLSITPKRVDAEERFTLNARGFNPNASVIVLFAIAGEEPYGTYTPPLPTTAEGTYSIPFVFAQCRQQDTGGDVTVDLTITLVDSFGVQDSAPLVLC